MIIELLLVGQIHSAKAEFILMTQNHCLTPYHGQAIILDERVSQILTSRKPLQTIKRLNWQYPKFMKSIMKDLAQSGYLEELRNEDHKKTTNEDDKESQKGG